jgi:hypothetical protein
MRSEGGVVGQSTCSTMNGGGSGTDEEEQAAEKIDQYATSLSPTPPAKCTKHLLRICQAACCERNAPERYFESFAKRGFGIEELWRDENRNKVR